MKRIAIFSLVLLLGACASQPPQRFSSAPPASPAPLASPEAQSPKSLRSAQPFEAIPSSIGTDALAAIRAWYADTRTNCGSATMPAFLCSGVMLRATETNPSFLPWDPSPASVSSGGVSFSWIRRDMNFAQLVYSYQNGFVFYPSELEPSGKDRYQVLCIFPMDANTNNRPAEQGCGPNTQAPVTSAPCDTQNITTGAQWATHFAAIVGKYNGQCGWNVRRGAANDTANRFMQAIDARGRMPQQWWLIQDELRIATWPQGSGASLPIRAFFYVPGKTGALANAQNDQQRYRGAYGIDIPIIRLTLPTTQTGSTVFAYADADQTGSGPSPSPGETIDFEDVPLQGPSLTASIHGIVFQAISRARPFYVEPRMESDQFISRNAMVLRNDDSDDVFSLDMKPPAPIHSISVAFLKSYDAPDTSAWIICSQQTGPLIRSYLVGRTGRASCVAPAGSALLDATVIDMTPGRDRKATLVLDNIVIEK